MTGRVVITAVDCMTGVGLDATSTAAAVRAGVSRLRESDQFLDRHGNPVVESCIPWLPADEEEPEEDTAPPAADGDDPAADDDAGGEGPENPDDPDAADAADDDGGDVSDPWELARQTDDVERVVAAARQSLAALLDSHFPPGRPVAGSAALVVGVAGAWRPGPRFEGAAHPEGAGYENARALLGVLHGRFPRAELTLVPTGNASAIHGLALAAQRVASDPAALCVVAGIDSLLPIDTLNWYESAGRLKSVTPGRNHALSPAEAVGFFVVESAQSARRAGRRVLAEVAGVGMAAEPNPFLSDRPSRAEGLTAACRGALAARAPTGDGVGTVLADLDGEFHRSKEWALVQSRCFRGVEAPPLLHPADCFGSVGAASGAVLVGIACAGLAGGWFTKPLLVVCSDDAGECGAVLLAPPTTA
jgi:3-oxoacyl-[acyl-carrier-protein] synthase I